MSRPGITITKRQREQAKRARKKEKQRRKEQRQAEKEVRKADVPQNEDPDIAGIVPGPQADPFDEV